MRIALGLALALSLSVTGCAKKKAPQSPANAAPSGEAAPAAADMKSSDAPAEGDEDAKDTHTSDPTEGGE